MSRTTLLTHGGWESCIAIDHRTWSPRNRWSLWKFESKSQSNRSLCLSWVVRITQNLYSVRLEQSGTETLECWTQPYRSGVIAKRIKINFVIALVFRITVEAVTETWYAAPHHAIWWSRSRYLSWTQTVLTTYYLLEQSSRLPLNIPYFVPCAPFSRYAIARCPEKFGFWRHAMFGPELRVYQLIFKQAARIPAPAWDHSKPVEESELSTI